MKKTYIFRVLLFILIITLPLYKLNTEIGVKSTIDNKYLEDFPDIDLGFSDFTKELNNYLSERLGGRERLFQLNASINDKLFGYLEHSLYEYGEDGYVFFKMGRFEEDFEFIDLYTDFLLQIQDYCNDRQIPFVYALNPAKWSIYSDYLPKGYHYQNERLEYLQWSLEEKGIVYVDFTDHLKKLSTKEQVFNPQYDAGHWNALGAFYSVNQLLEKMSEFDPNIKPNQVEDYEITEELKTTHRVSNIKMQEYVPVFTPKSEIYQFVDMQIRNEIILSPQYTEFFRTVSNAENNVDLLMFQGSGFNGLGYPFVAAAVEKYQGIHNYQNLIDFDYYFNLFKPNFVVVNTAEYATTANYFDIDKMKNKKLNSVLDPTEYTYSEATTLTMDVDFGQRVNTVWFEDMAIESGYLLVEDDVYDLVYHESGKWYVSGLRNKLNLTQARLYLRLNTGEKIFIDLEM